MSAGRGSPPVRVTLMVFCIAQLVLFEGGLVAEAFPGLPCFNNSQCDSPSRCVGGFCCLYNMGFSCQACANVTGECLINDCNNCAPGEECVFRRDPEHGCCKSSVNARTCFTYCNFTGDCNDLFDNGDLCEIDQQCRSDLCLGELNFENSYCCKPDVGFTCTACEQGTGNCIAQNFLVYVMGAMAVLLALTGISCLVSGRSTLMTTPGGTGIDDYGRNAVRVLSPFDDEEGSGGSGERGQAQVQASAEGEELGEVLEATLMEEEGDDEEQTEALSAEIIPAPTGRPSL